jgi:hypothetical protein
MSDRTQCGECNAAFTTRGPEDGKKLAIWAVGSSGHTTSCLLCAGCYARFRELGSGGIPNAYGLSWSDANAGARMRRGW